MVIVNYIVYWGDYYRPAQKKETYYAFRIYGLLYENLLLILSSVSYAANATICCVRGTWGISRCINMKNCLCVAVAVPEM